MTTRASASMPPPSPEQAAHAGRVHARICEEIAASGGWIGFDRYMELALYSPGLGYYAAGARKFGRLGEGGDFVTAPEISPLFAQALAAQVAQAFESVPAHIVEFGAGSGRLARDLLAALAERGRAVDRYDIVELSPELRVRQRELLTGGCFHWRESPPPGLRGVIIANEVLDVMPVRLFVRTADELQERGVTLRTGALAFAPRPAEAALAEAVSEIEHDVGRLADGYGSEVGLAARGWMRSAGEWLAHGVLLAIDYGFPRREYYHPQRLMGTLMCHYRHHAHTDPLWLPGLNDITAHVDFTAMAHSAHDGGLRVLGYTSQARFLLNCGLLEIVQRAATPQAASAVHRLVSEAEMGELVKVIAVGRGLDVPLVGFADGDRTHTL